MLPAPREAVEQQLWDAHAELDAARESGHGIGAADGQARELVAAYLQGSVAHRDALGSFMRRLEAEETDLDKELERLGRLRAEAESDRRRFRAHILAAMVACEAKSVRGRFCSFHVSRAPDRLVVDQSKLPAHFTRVVPAASFVRERAIRAALKSGERVPGVRVEPDGPRLLIR